ncbi:MAG: hypothetical protein AB1483_08505 [Candidatus Zixiibacteriota bacterium]
MKATRVILIVAAVLLMASQALAFDGNRKGLVLGFGLGAAPLLKGTEGNPAEDFERSGLVVNLMAGYAFNENDVVLLIQDAAIYSQTAYREALDGSLVAWDDRDLQGFWGVGYRRYFAPAGRSMFVTAALGIEGADDDWGMPSGLGILVGSGYEITRHIELYASFATGKIDYGEGEDTFSQIVFSLTGVLY